VPPPPPPPGPGLHSQCKSGSSWPKSMLIHADQYPDPDPQHCWWHCIGCCYKAAFGAVVSQVALVTIAVTVVTTDREATAMKEIHYRG
jgi:hypothetical protein